jgi:hypothetical protein
MKRYRCLKETGSVLNKSPGHPRTFSEDEECIGQALYKLQLYQHMKPADQDATKTFYKQMLDKIHNVESFLNSMLF